MPIVHFQPLMVRMVFSVLMGRIVPTVITVLMVLVELVVLVVLFVPKPLAKALGTLCIKKV